jgi:hypothetical protein
MDEFRASMKTIANRLNVVKLVAITILCSALNSGVSLKRLDRLWRKGATKPIGVAVGIANAIGAVFAAYAKRKDR